MCYNSFMKKKLLRILAGALILTGAIFPTAAFACTENSFFGLDPWYAGLTCEQDANGKEVVSQSNFAEGQIVGTVGQIVGTVVKDLLFVAGWITVVMVIVGGVQYVLSAGDPGAVAKAKKTISGALTGLIISVLAYAIVTFIMTRIGAK